MPKLTPSEKAVYDEAAARLAGTRRTFPEKEAMQQAWERGQKLYIHYDYAKRFEAVDLPGQTERHWRLKEHVLANDRLFNEWLNGEWDGRDLDARLEQYDLDSKQHHVFCPIDKRFRQKSSGTWELVVERPVPLPPEIRQSLDALKETLLARWAEQADAHPWTVDNVLAILTESGWSGVKPDRARHYIHFWLIEQPEIIRVGKDYWMLANRLPEEVRRTRLAVLPQRDVVQGKPNPDGDLANEGAVATTPQVLKAKVSRRSIESDIFIGGQIGSMTASWKTTLRTIHLQEGFIPIPKKVQSIYPPLTPGERQYIVSSARWYDDNSTLWLWIDREKHRLYGPDLRQLFDNELLDPGTILQIDWDTDAILLRRVGLNEQIQEEEARLVDLEELKQLRGGIGESYRRSLQFILEAHPQGLTLAELIAALRERQQHQVHSGGIRTLLFSGGFLRKGQHWFAAPNDAHGARHLRSALLESLVPQEQLASTPVSPEAFVSTRAQAIRKRLQEIVAELQNDVD